MSEKSIARMRTVDQCFREIKFLDPASCISKWMLYQLAKENRVKNFKSGTRFYIDLDALLSFFNLDFMQENKSDPTQSA